MSKYSELPVALRDCAAGGLVRALNEGEAYDLSFLDEAADAICELEAELSVLNGTACTEEQSKGKGPCGICKVCLRASRDRLRGMLRVLFDSAGVDDYGNCLISLSPSTLKEVSDMLEGE